VTPRRTWIAGGVAAAAMLAGAGWSVWRGRTQPDALRPGPVVDDRALWAMTFPQPDGQPLAMAQLRGRPLVLNFWATWCAPCVKEMPELDRFHRDHAAQGWQVVGIAIDQPEPVREFLQRIPVGFTIAVAGLAGMELLRTLGNSSGALPFTVVFGADGQVLQRKLGETTARELARWAREA
jgi:thiol-disulfide isomerase/thioredoxin